MDLGSASQAKLEPFLLMSKSARGAAAAKLAQDVTAAPGVFVFAELLDLPTMQDLASNPQHAPFLQLLKLFSYGTYTDYQQQKEALPSLNSAQITKLKYLTLVSLASERRILPYSDLLTILEMPSVRALEDLIIDTIYIDILRGRLDQRAQQLEVEYTMGRDLAPGRLQAVGAALQEWAQTTSSLLSTLDHQLASLDAQASDRTTAAANHDRRVAQVLKELADKKDKKKPSGADRSNVLGGAVGSGTAYDDPMEVDEPEGMGKGKNRKTQRGQDENTKQRLKRNRY